jgi:RNA-directed DNA polymerase
VNNAELIIALSNHLRIKSSEVQQIVRTSPYRYKHYQIDKRSGGKRDIYHPTPELKVIQRWLVSKIFSLCPVSHAASAYEHGSKIRDNAAQHIHSNYFLKLDFRDFFPSIDIFWINEFQKRSLPHLDSEARATVARLVCRWASSDKPLALSIGAPSSPAISNRILHELDQAILAISNPNDVTYTRYADDIYLSTRQPEILKDIERKVRAAIARTTPKLSLNEGKTLNLSRKRRVSITGLVVTPQRRISLGRDLKRQIKTEVHLWCAGKLRPETAATLRGLVSYAADVEPRFIDSLRLKFGSGIIFRLLGSQ